MDQEPTGTIEFTPTWWQEKLPRMTRYSVSFAVDGEPGPRHGAKQRFSTWVGEMPALWGSTKTVSVPAGTHTVRAWMTVYRDDGQGNTFSSDFEYLCKTDVDVSADQTVHVTYAIERQRRFPITKLLARLRAD